MRCSARFAVPFKQFAFKLRSFPGRLLSPNLRFQGETLWRRWGRWVCVQARPVGMANSVPFSVTGGGGGGIFEDYDVCLDVFRWSEGYSPLSPAGL